MGKHISDNFNRPDAPTLGSNWNVVQGTSFSIVSNAAHAPPGQTPPINVNTYGNETFLNVAVTVDVTVAPTGLDYAGVVLRSNGTDAGISYYWGVLYEYQPTDTHLVLIGTFASNVPFVIGSANLGAGGPTSGKLTLEARDSTLNLYLNDALLVTVNDTTITGEGSVGLIDANTITGGVFDSFSAKQIICK